LQIILLPTFLFYFSILSHKNKNEMQRKKVPKNMKMTGINKIALKIQEKPGIKNGL